MKAALNAHQTSILELLSPIIASSLEARALFAQAPPGEGEVLRLPDVAEGLERLAAEGAAPFYTGEVATAVWKPSRTKQILAAARICSRRASRYCWLTLGTPWYSNVPLVGYFRAHHERTTNDDSFPAVHPLERAAPRQ